MIYGNSVLREIAQPVEELTPEIEALVKEMAETMYAGQGVGLAAPQVGELLRVVTVDVDQIKNKKEGGPNRSRLQVFFNPEIVRESDEDSMIVEGCLSVPGMEGEVYRPAVVRARARNARFKPVEFEAKGMLARVLQHEIDHLNGVLFPDRMARMKRITLAPQLALLRKKGREQGKALVA